MWGSSSLCSARTSCGSSLVAVVIFLPLFNATVTALILNLGLVLSLSFVSSGLAGACCVVLCFLLLLALPSCTWSSTGLVGEPVGIGDVPSLIAVECVDVDAEAVLCCCSSTLCFFVVSVLAFFASVSTSFVLVACFAAVVGWLPVFVSSCDVCPAWTCCSVDAGVGGSMKAGWNPIGGVGFHGVPVIVSINWASYLFVPASRLIVRERTILPAMPMKDSPVDVHLPSQMPL